MMSGIPYIVRRQGHGSSHELARHPIYAGAPPELWQSLIAQALFPKQVGRADEFAIFIEESVRNPLHNGRAYRLDAGMILPAFP